MEVQCEELFTAMVPNLSGSADQQRPRGQGMILHTGLPLAHALTRYFHGPIPNRPQTSMVCRPGVEDPRSTVLGLPLFRGRYSQN